MRKAIESSPQWCNNELILHTQWAIVFLFTAAFFSVMQSLVMGGSRVMRPTYRLNGADLLTSLLLCYLEFVIVWQFKF